MNNDKELHDLWCSSVTSNSMNPDELLAIAKRRTAEFDRLIRRRNVREICAALLVAVFFAWSAYKAEGALARTGNIVVPLSMVWIIGYMLRFSREPKAPDASADLETYREAMLRRFDQQIRLLSKVKYWYLLPPYLGLMLLFASGFAGHARPGWAAYVAPVLVTIVYAGIWYLNEVYAVGRLRAERARLIEIYGTQGHDTSS